MFVDKNSRMPLYVQLMDIVIADIEKNFKEEDRLPSEREICLKYDVSRSTVRQALDELEREGYINKIHGKGTFVSAKKLRQDLAGFYSFTEEMKKLGKKPESKVLDFEIINPSIRIKSLMKLSEQDRVYKLSRIRIADNIPMMFETSYIPYDRFEGITREELENQALYDVFKNKYKICLTSAQEEFQAIIINAQERKNLNIEEGSAGLKIVRYTYENEDLIEYTESIARGDKFKYRVRLENK